MGTAIIAGGTGLLGLNWLVYKHKSYPIVTTVHSHSVNLPGITPIKLDLNNADLVEDLIRKHKPSFLVNCVAMSDVDISEKKPELAIQLNAQVPRDLAKICKEHNVKFVHISTDHIFDGKKSMYTENDQPNPINQYAVSKIKGEEWVTSENPDALIIRTNFFGWGHKLRKSFSDWIYGSLSEKKSINCYDDVYFTPIHIFDLINSIETLISLNARGIFNICSSNRISKFDFAMELANLFNFDQSLIKRAKYPTGQLPRPRDMSLSGKKFESLTNSKLPSIKDGLLQLKKDIQSNHSSQVNATIVI